MDPITLILTALVAGAIAGTQSTAAEGIKDTYHGLKALIQRKFAGKPDAELALLKHEEKPEIWKEPLKEALIEATADQDEQIIKEAQKLIELVNPQQVALSKFNTQIMGNVQGFVTGDNAQVTMSFGEKPQEK
jgi:hypothetical protein